jgi:hypothetical protein
MRFRKPLSLMIVALLVAGVAGAVALKLGTPGVNMTKSAKAFLSTLSKDEKALAVMGFADERRVGWHFIPKRKRKGLQLRNLNDTQRKAAHKLLADCLSEAGYDRSVQIMNLEQILHKQQGGKTKPWNRDSLKYYWTVFGEPTEKGQWGLSIEGHHLSLNFVVKDGRVTSHTPNFFASNPATVKADYGVGAKKGTRVLRDIEVLGFELVNSLDADQAKIAVLAKKAPREIRTPGSAQPPQTAAEGLPASKMTAAQTAKLQKLIEAYSLTMAKKISDTQLAEIKAAGFGKVHFAWAGAKKEGIGHYYRVQGPTFLIEFVNTQPDGDGNPANHIHAVWRSMKGDFGLEL